MKLAELLINRSARQKRIDSLRERVKANATAQEMTKPHEDPKKLLNELLRENAKLRELVVAINQANLSAKLDDDRSLMEAIAQRDELMAEHAILRSAAKAAQTAPSLYSAREVAWISQLNVSELEQRADQSAESVRQLNAQIQQVNWTFEV